MLAEPFSCLLLPYSDVKHFPVFFTLAYSELVGAHQCLLVFCSFIDRSARQKSLLVFHFTFPKWPKLENKEFHAQLSAGWQTQCCRHDIHQWDQSLAKIQRKLGCSGRTDVLKLGLGSGHLGIESQGNFFSKLATTFLGLGVLKLGQSVIRNISIFCLDLIKDDSMLSTKRE